MPTKAKKKAKPLPKWSELFPEGRTIFYEGDDPKAFVKEIKAKFDIDPSKNNPSWCKKGGYGFFCPPEHLDAIYGSGKYLLES